MTNGLGFDRLTICAFSSVVQLARLVFVRQHTMPILLPTVRDATPGIYTTQRRRDNSIEDRIGSISTLRQTCRRQCSTSERQAISALAFCQQVGNHTNQFFSFFAILGISEFFHVSQFLNTSGVHALEDISFNFFGRGGAVEAGQNRKRAFGHCSIGSPKKKALWSL